jgi:hypothetical protein
MTCELALLRRHGHPDVSANEALLLARVPHRAAEQRPVNLGGAQPQWPDRQGHRVLTGYATHVCAATRCVQIRSGSESGFVQVKRNRRRHAQPTQPFTYFQGN